MNIKQYEKDNTFVFRYDMQSLLPQLKQEYNWLAVRPAVSLQRITNYLDKAIRDIKKGKGFPKFKKKTDNKDSFYLSNQTFSLVDNKVKLPKIGLIAYKTGRLPEGKKIMGATITPDGDHCGHVQPMPLNIRTYDCSNCGAVIDKDVNASINIKQWGYDIGQGLSENYACGDISDRVVQSVCTASYVSLKQEDQILA